MKDEGDLDNDEIELEVEKLKDKLKQTWQKKKDVHQNWKVVTELEEAWRVMLDLEQEDEKTSSHPEEVIVNISEENLSTITSSVSLNRKRYNNDNIINESVLVEIGVTIFGNEEEEHL